MKTLTGIVLSGGGARGIAHAGVLQALDEIGIPIGRISGTSAGAIIGAMYAGGVKPADMPDIVIKSNLFEIRGLSFDFKGLLKTDAFRKILKKYLTATSFEELKIPLTVCATDFNNARSVFFDHGQFTDPIVASCTIPMVFSPVIIEGTTYLDGGLLNNFPVEPLVGKCAHIIGVHVNPLGVYNAGGGFTGMLERCFHMAIANNVKSNSGKCDVFIEPSALNKYTVFDTKYAREIFDIGYKATIEKKEQLLKLSKK